MPTYEDFAAWAQKSPRAGVNSIERSIVNGVAVAMSELRADPNWKLFCDHIEPLRRQEEARITRLEHDLNYGPITADHQHYELKRQLAISKTRFDTYTQVLQLIDSLIARGNPLTPAA